MKIQLTFDNQDDVEELNMNKQINSIFNFGFGQKGASRMKSIKDQTDQLSIPDEGPHKIVPK